MEHPPEGSRKQNEEMKFHYVWFKSAQPRPPPGQDRGHHFCDVPGPRPGTSQKIISPVLDRGRHKNDVPGLARGGAAPI